MKPLIVDTLASGKGVRFSTRDVIGAGPRAVAGVLEVRGFEPVICPVEEYLNGVFDGFDVLLISGMTSDIQAVQKSVRKWRSNHDGPVVIGGPAASEPERVLRRTGGDIAVTGEGEYAIVELLDAGLDLAMMPTNLQDIRGISYRHRKKVKINPLRPLQANSIFNEFPPSTKTITGYPLYKSARVYVEAVRGCSNFNRARIGPIGEKCVFCEQCTEAELTERYDCPSGIPPGCGYCSVPSLYGPPKSREAPLIINEVKELFALGVHRIVLSAPGFLDYQRDQLVSPEPLTDPRSPEPNYEKIVELLSGLTGLPEVKSGNASILIENIKAALVTERAAGILGRYLRDTPVSVGFETGSDAHSRLLGRPDTPSETLVSLRRLKAAGLKPYVYFIHGLPGQNSETVEESVDMIEASIKAGSDRVILYRFMSLPYSSFTGCPSGSPAFQDPLSKRIYDAAEKANMTQKKDLVGNVLRIVIAERYNRDMRYWVAYPMHHGPVTLIKTDDIIQSGDVLSVKITGVASERIVYGTILER